MTETFVRHLPRRFISWKAPPLYAVLAGPLRIGRAEYRLWERRDVMILVWNVQKDGKGKAAIACNWEAVRHRP